MRTLAWGLLLLSLLAPTQVEAEEAGAAGSRAEASIILLADGAQVVRASYPLRILPGEFAEIVLEVNESFVNSERTTFTVGGDHISLGYRLYQ